MPKGPSIAAPWSAARSADSSVPVVDTTTRPSQGIAPQRTGAVRTRYPWRVRWFVLATVATLSTACIRLNPNFGDDAQADGSAEGGSSNSNTSVATTAPGPTDGRDEGSADGASGTPTSDASAATSMSSMATGPGTDVDTEDTEREADTSARPDADEPLVVLFAARTTGQFGASGTLAESAAMTCAFEETNLEGGMLCSEAPFAIIASSSSSYSAVSNAHPELLELPLVGPDGQEIATSFATLSEGKVLGPFAESVTSALSTPASPNFWWGPNDEVPDDCQLWGVLNDEGRMLRFEPATSSIAEDDAVPCTALQLLLCGCVVEG